MMGVTRHWRKLAMNAAAMAMVFALATAANAEKRLSGIQPVEGIEVDFFTPQKDAMAKLPKTATITLTEGDPIPVELEWKLDQPYFPYTYGNYTAIGTFKLPEGVKQSEPETPLEVWAVVDDGDGEAIVTLLLPEDY